MRDWAVKIEVVVRGDGGTLSADLLVHQSLQRLDEFQWHRRSARIHRASQSWSFVVGVSGRSTFPKRKNLLLLTAAFDGTSIY